MKRVLALLAAVSLCVSFLPVHAQAEEGTILPAEGEGVIALTEATETAETFAGASGSCGANLTWTFSDEGRLTISGAGEMQNYERGTATPWYGFRENITSVVIKSNVTSIGDYAFDGCTALARVKIPTSVTGIGKGAFYQSGLMSVTIPDSVTELESYAFEGCKNLKSVTIPGRVTTIGQYVFAGCSSLTNAVLSEGVTSTGIGLFDSCSALTAATLPQSLTAIGSFAFCGCESLKSITIPGSVTIVGEYAFTECTSLTAVTIPAGVAAIGEWAFSDCGSLKTVCFRGAAPLIGDGCFYDVTATAFYPAGNATWTAHVRQDYGGNITWIAREPSPDVTLAASTKGVAVSWTALSGATKYQVQRSTDGGDWKNLQTVTTLSCLDADVTMGMTYAYRVRAYVSGAWGDWSDAAETLFNPFEDVSGNKTIGYVAWAYNNGIVSGTSETTFSPNNPCTRIQFVMMLWKMNGSPAVTGVENPFKDITNGTKSCKAVLWALKTGIINAGKSFNPNGNITRSQVVMMLWKMAGEPKVTGVTNPFTDVTDGTKLCKAVLWAYKNGITTGTSATTFSPDNNCTRVQLVIFLYKYNGL